MDSEDLGDFKKMRSSGTVDTFNTFTIWTVTIMNRKIIVLVANLALIGSLAACSNTPSNKASDSPTGGAMKQGDAMKSPSPTGGAMKQGDATKSPTGSAMKQGDAMKSPSPTGDTMKKP
jgi:hypothetical protein